MSGPFSAPTDTAPSASCLSQHDRPLELGTSLHDLIHSALNSSDQFQTSQTSFSVAGATPKTPQRQLQTSSAVAPLTPLANLKVLAEASSAVEEREGGCEGVSLVKSEWEGGAGVREEEGGRKMKSLSLLCKKFLSIVEGDVGNGNEFSLDMMAQKLGTNRRRIYDIINVLESVEMVVKQSKNLYSWRGSGHLLDTLAKLRAMAVDDPDLIRWFTDSDKENETPPTASVAKQQGQSSSVMDECSQDSIPDDIPFCDDAHTRGGRWDKSLGVLCQKFIMLFLIAPNHELTLDKAGTILIPEEASSVNTKTKVRRLYDIANVLTTLDLIRKKTFMAANHRKMPGYVWCGPSVGEIDSVSVSKKMAYQSTEMAVGPERKKKGASLVRHHSFGSRPFLHQYEVKDSTSAPSTPCKPTAPPKPRSNRGLGNFRGGSIRRSLSFGGQGSKRGVSGGCGHVGRVGGAKSEDGAIGTSGTSVCSREEFAREMRQFELMMTKNAHQFPNVAAMFQDFTRRYQFSLEWTGTTRPLLPKPTSNFSEGPLRFSTPQNTENPPKYRSRLETSENISSSLGTEMVSEADNKSEVEFSVARQQKQEDSGLGDSLVGGASMTSLDDVITSQQSGVGTETEKPRFETEKCRSLEKKQTRTSNRDSDVSLTTTRPPTLSLSLSTHPEREGNHTNPITASTHAPISSPPPALASPQPLSLIPKQGKEWMHHTHPTHPLTEHTPSLRVSEGDSKTDSKSVDSGNVALSDVSLCLSPHTQYPKVSNSPPGVGGQSSEVRVRLPLPAGFTKGTLQSPEKPAHGHMQSFVRVHDFLTALAVQSKEAENLLRDPGFVANLAVPSPQPVSLLSHLLTRQPLPGATTAKPPNTMATPLSSVHVPRPHMLDPKSLVNQKPILSAVELKSSAANNCSGSDGVSGDIKQHTHTSFPHPLPPSRPFPRQILPTESGSHGFTTLLAVPSAGFSVPQNLLPGTMQGFVPLVAPRMCLPPFSTLCQPTQVAMPTTCCPATSQTGTRPPAGECPPMKRAKLFN